MKPKKVKPPVEEVLPPDPTAWCASWLFDPKVRALPPGVRRDQVVRTDRPGADRRGRPKQPPGGGTWVLAVPPAWVK